MSEFRQVTPDFAVAAQLAIDDMARAAAAGFKTVIVNRPDNEAPGQPSANEIKSAAEASGLTFREIPFSGLPPAPAVVMETARALDEANGPVLAYCRSGTRSITAWALAQALAGELAAYRLHPSLLDVALGAARLAVGPDAVMRLGSA